MADFRQKVASLYRGISRELLLRLLAVPFVLSLIDLTVTLVFQPEAYWQGDRSVVVEANPIARWAFLIHPFMIIPGLIGWYAIVIPVIFKSPAWLGLRVHVFLVLGHLITISGWLTRNSESGTLLTTMVWLIALPLAWFLFRPFRQLWSSNEPVSFPKRGGA